MARLLTEKRVVGAIVVAVYAITLAASLEGIGLTDDADFYMNASLKYAEWWGKVLSDAAHLKLTAFNQHTIDDYWQHNHEHPPLAKLVMGASHAVFTKLLGVTKTTIDGIRMGTVLLSSALALLLFSLAWDMVGRAAAIFAPLALLAMPRFFFHSHVETLDVPVAATFFGAFYCFWKARDSWRWALAAGVAFGLALATKLNAPFLFATLLVWWGVKNADDFAWVPGRGLAVPRVPLWIVSMAVLGAAVFFALWPWMWFDTFERMNSYIGFHMKHYGILFSYFGHIYDEKPFAPWHAPWVMTGITTPPLTLLLGVFGAGLSAWWAVRRVPGPLISFGPSLSEERRDFYTLVLLCAFISIGTVSFMPVPKYGGVKLFLPFFPFFALLGGVGVQWLADHAAARLGDLTVITRSMRRRAVEVTLALLLVAPAAVSTARAHPYHLSYYNMLIGGAEGAAKAGMERQYYDVFYRDLAKWMSINLPPKAAVHFLPNNKEYVRSSPWYRKDGLMRPDIVFTQNMNQAQYLILTHEERWPEWPELKRRYGTLPSLYEISVEGVPLLNVYKLK